MSFMQVTTEEVRAAQALTTTTIASLVLVGLIPGLRPRAGRIRTIIAVGYIAAAIGFMGYLLVR